MITHVYYSNIADNEVLRYARETDEYSGEERLLEPHELEDPWGVEVGDEYAYKVHINEAKIFNNTEDD